MEVVEEDTDKPTQIQMTPEEVMVDRADSVYVLMDFTKRLKVDQGLRSLQMARAP